MTGSRGHGKQAADPPREQASAEGARLRDRVVELEQQVSALRLAVDQGDLTLAQFADLYDYAPVGYLTLDAAGVIHRVNVPAAALLGGSRQDLVGLKLVTLVRAADKTAFSAFVRAAFRETSPHAVEVGLVRGKWRAEHLEFIASPAASGRDLGHPGAQARLAVIDVTARRRAEEALRESRDRHRAVVASMAEGVVVFDAEGKARECNVAAQRILDLTEEEILGRAPVDPDWRIIREDGTSLPAAEHPARVLLATGKAQWDLPLGVRKPDGTVAWLRVNADPLREADGRVRGAVATFTDVTRRMEMERALAASEQRFRDLVDRSPEGIAVVQDGRVVLANPAAARIAGFATPGELESTRPESRMDAASAAAIQEATRRVLGGEIVKPFDIRLVAADGRKRIVETTGALVQFDGRPAIEVLVRDVTELRAAQAPAQATPAMREAGTGVAD